MPGLLPLPPDDQVQFALFRWVLFLAFVVGLGGLAWILLEPIVWRAMQSWGP